MDSPSRYRSDAPDREAVDRLEGATLLEFGTAWCGHCRSAQPWIDAALSAHPSVRHIAIEDGPGRRLGRSFGVKQWPTLIALANGQEIERIVRPRDAASIERMLATLQSAA